MKYSAKTQDGELIEIIEFVFGYKDSAYTKGLIAITIDKGKIEQHWAEYLSDVKELNQDS